jgi:hypothetical protein
VGPLLRVQSVTGRRLRDATNHLLGVDRAFLDFDRTGRAAYDARIAGAAEADTAEEPSGQASTTGS